MDASKFDELTKVLAQPTSRRQAFKVAAAAAAGGLLGLGRLDRAGAVGDPRGSCPPIPCQSSGAFCTNSAPCCSGFCNPQTLLCEGPTPCQARGGACSGSCACCPGSTCVNGTCVSRIASGTTGPPGVCGANFSTGSTAFACGSAGSGCVCAKSVEGRSACVENLCTGVACSSSSQCVTQFGRGAICVTGNTC